MLSQPVKGHVTPNIVINMYIYNIFEYWSVYIYVTELHIILILYIYMYHYITIYIRNS